MLIKLENGDWVDPRAVTAVKMWPSVPGSIASVRVSFGSEWNADVVFPFIGDDEAMEARDRIADQINAAREAKPC